MALRPTALGVDVRGDRVFLALVELRGRQPVVRRLVETSLPETATEDAHDIIAAVVARARRDEALAADRIVLGLPATRTIVRRVHVPVVGTRKVSQALAFAMEPLIPYAAEDIVADGMTIREHAGGSDLLVFAARRDDVAPLIQAMDQAGVRPERAVPDGVALLDAIPADGATAGKREAVFYLREGRGFFAVRDGGRFIEFRPLRGAAESPALRRDARRSLMALLEDDPPLSRVVLAGEAAALAEVAAGFDVPCEEVAVALPAQVSEAVAAGLGDCGPWDVAVCLAAQGVQPLPHAVNLCRGELSLDRLAIGLAPLKRTAMLAGFTLLVYTASLATQRLVLRRQRDALRSSIQTQFAASLPGVTSVDAAHNRLREVRAVYEDLGRFVRPKPAVLDVLAACDAAMRAVPKVRIQSLNLSGDVLRVTGEVADFHAVTQLEGALADSPLLRDVQTTRAGEGRHPGSTSFRLNARLNVSGTLAQVEMPPAAETPPAPAQPGSTGPPAGLFGTGGEPGPAAAAPPEPAQTEPAPVATGVQAEPQQTPVVQPVSGEQSILAPGGAVPGRASLDDLFADPGGRVPVGTGSRSALFTLPEEDDGA